MYRYHTIRPDLLPATSPGAFGFVLPVLHLLFWLVIVVLIVRLLSRHRHFDHRLHAHGQTSALDIAKTRYAKGEVTKAEFEALKKDLL